MKKSHLSIIGALPLVLVLFACSAPGGGPRTWIDKPRDNTIIPLAPVGIMAHASDSEGVASIEFYVNGQFMQSVVPNPDPNAGTRLVNAEWEFIPAGPGLYRIEASAIDSGGNAGAPASATVTVSGDAEAPLATDKPPTEPPGTEAPGTEPPATQPPPTEPPASGDVSVSFYASPASVSAGNCTTLHWDVVGTDKVFWNGNAVYFRGMEERCPCEVETHKLSVIKPDGSTQDYWTTIDVTGSCSAPPTDPPPSDVIEPDPIEVDNEGPYIHDFGAEPNKIMKSGVSCTNYQNTTTVWVVTVDDSGIGSVTAYWSIGSESGTTPMAEGWLGYGGDIGPVSTSGTMSVYIVVRDVPGNVSQTSTFNVTVYENCIN